MAKFLSSLLLFSSIFLFSQQVKNVFFIGNSYTAYNSLPNLVKQIAQSTGDDLVFQQHSPGGTTLQQHATNANVSTIIDQGNWDYVVLQEQSQIPSFPDIDLQQFVYPYATQLANDIKTSNPCATPIFYMTWGRKNGDTQFCPQWAPVCTYQGMDDRIYNAYMNMALENESMVSPVGKVWRNIRTQYPTMELYSSDESHPSLLGSLAAAYTFYVTIFKKDPELATFNGGISQADANIIRTVVKNTVFNSLDTWYINSHDIHSEFSYTSQPNNMVQFQNQSSNATTFLWNFGDGNTSTLENPTHTYATAGIYDVTLTTNACGRSTTRMQQVNSSQLSTSETQISKIKIYPNPASEFVIIESDKKVSGIEIFDFSGRKISKVASKEEKSIYKIDIQNLTAGNYILRVKIGSEIYSEEFVKK